MELLTSEQILNLSLQSSRQDTQIEYGEIDYSLPFYPEQFTQLFHTPLYTTLNDQQRLSYNQFCGMSGNEHFMLFESGFTNRVMTKLAGHPLVKRDPALYQCLQIMLEEERRHSAMFRELNLRCLPQIYHKQAYHFTRMSFLEQALLWTVTSMPQHLIFLIWLVLIMEEHSNHIARRTLSEPDTETLGPLEPNFIKTHKAHLQDESRHVHIDARLLTLFIDHASQLKRKTNAHVMRSMLLEILTPKRAGLRIIRFLIQKHPELADRSQQLLTTVRALKIDPGFALTLAEVKDRPLTAMLHENYPEFFYFLTDRRWSINA